MKLYFNVSILFVFLIFSTSCFAQKLSKKEVVEKITRSWTAVEVGNSEGEMKPKEMKEVMIFDGEGAFTMEQESKMMGMMKMAGEWKYDKKDNTIKLKMTTDGRTETVALNILELTDNRLVLEGIFKTVVFIPSENVVEEVGLPTEPAAVAVVVVAELNPEAWTGSLAYNAIFLMDDSDEQIEEAWQGVISLGGDGENKIITNVENESTLIWTVTGEMTIAGNTSYSVDCSDPKYSGEITFQNGFLMLQVYEPSYMSYFFVKK